MNEMSVHFWSQLAAVGSWLATYWVHSTLALGAAWLLERARPREVPSGLALWVGGWLLGGAALLLGLARAWRRLRSRLSDRVGVCEGPARATLPRLRRLAGWPRRIVLTRSAAIEVPIAM